jgi:hypothetical protein
VNDQEHGHQQTGNAMRGQPAVKGKLQRRAPTAADKLLTDGGQQIDAQPVGSVACFYGYQQEQDDASHQQAAHTDWQDEPNGIGIAAGDGPGHGRAPVGNQPLMTHPSDDETAWLLVGFLFQQGL